MRWISSLVAGQGNPSNVMLYSDDNQMQNLVPLKISTSGDGGSGYFSHNRG